MRWILALHIMAVISWMAGLLYLFRLYVYHAMEQEPVVRSRFEVMERRLLQAITTPAMIVSVLTGGAMLAQSWGYYLSQPWMHLKLTFVVGMLGCHHLAGAYRKKLVINSQVKSHRFFRVMNEVPTLLMIGIVIAVIVRPFAR